MARRPSKGKGRKPEPVTVEHVLNSLAQIELWVRSVRAALSKLDPEQELEVSEDVAEDWSGSVAPLITGKWCPPPE